MSDESNTRRLNVEAARDGGYLVTGVSEYRPMSDLLFAGTLHECLHYVSDRFEPQTAGRATDVEQNVGLPKGAAK